MMTVRVLMLLPNLRVSSGVSTYAMNHYRMVNHGMFHIDFALLKDVPSAYYEEILKTGSNVYVLPPLKNLKHHMKKCRDILSDGAYDIVHDNCLMSTYPMMLTAKKYVNIRILHSHSAKLGETSFREKRNKLFVHFLLKTASHYMACSSKAGSALFGKRSFDIVPNIINVDVFKFSQTIRDKVRERYQCVDKCVIGTVGRLTDTKNPFFAIDVIDKVIDLIPNVEYWWIGSGVLDNRVVQYVKKMKNSEKIRLFGSREDVPNLYQAMDVFFLPSKSEGFGLACLEAQTAGLPCIISDAFPPEINVTGDVTCLSLRDGKNKWIETVQTRIKRKNMNRNCGFDLVKKSMYSGLTSGKVLSDLYLKYLGSH